MDQNFDNPEILIRAGSQAPIQGSTDRYTGNVRIDTLFDANESAQYVGASVSFEPGARTVWHVHPLGQRLLVKAGTGYIQEWGGQVVEIREGDVYWVRPGIKHWHGATSSTSMTHIALTGMLDGKSAEWLDKVSDEEYSNY